MRTFQHWYGIWGIPIGLPVCLAPVRAASRRVDLGSSEHKLAQGERAGLLSPDHW
jgi:hypothetical protein